MTNEQLVAKYIGCDAANFCELAQHAPKGSLGSMLSEIDALTLLDLNSLNVDEVRRLIDEETGEDSSVFHPNIIESALATIQAARSFFGGDWLRDNRKKFIQHI